MTPALRIVPCLQDLCRRAGLSSLGKRFVPDTSAQETELRIARQRIAIIQGLLDMRRAGFFQAVHCHADVLAVSIAETRIARRIRWTDAARLVETWRASQHECMVEHTSQPPKKAAGRALKARSAAA